MELMPTRLDGLKPSTTVLLPVRYHRSPPVDLDLADMEAESLRDIEGFFAQLAQGAPAVTHYVMADAMVVGQGTVISTGGRVVHEAAFEFLAPGNVPDGLERVGDGPEMRLKCATKVSVDRPSLLAKRPWAQNFGHFLVDAAALLTLADRLRLPADWQIIITRFDNPRLRETAHEVIASLAPDVTVVEHPDTEVWNVEQLHYVSPVNFPPMTKRPETLAMLRMAMVKKQHEFLAASRRIFVSRGPGSLRRLVNEDEIVALCQARGFEVVLPDCFPIDEQAALFRQARFVIGVKGAALTNLLFGTAGATALILTPSDFPDPFFWDICAQTGIGYAEMAGKRTTELPRGQNSFVIDSQRFAQLLDRLLREQEIRPISAG